MEVNFADHKDLEYLAAEDHHLRSEIIERKIAQREILLLWYDNRRAGFLRYGYFWDEIPFMNLLWVHEAARNRGFGTHLISRWESEMRKLGHEMVMTSTLSNERAQHLYRKLDYEDCGSLLLPGEPLELVFLKKLATPSTVS